MTPDFISSAFTKKTSSSLFYFIKGKLAKKIGGFFMLHVRRINYALFYLVCDAAISCAFITSKMPSSGESRDLFYRFNG
jgi:hypothetical protein